MGVVEAVLAQPVVVSNEIVFEVHGGGLYMNQVGVRRAEAGIRAGSTRSTPVSRRPSGWSSNQR